MKRRIQAAVMLLMSVLPMTTMTAQKKVTVDFQADLVSNHLWRGLDYGNVSIQPSATVSYRGAYANMFGSTGFDKDDIERVDLSVGYKAPFGVNIGVGSHWMTGLDNLNRYFYFDTKDTGHRFEGNVGYSCKYFSLQGYCIFYGNDFKLNGDRAYSTYIELSVPFRYQNIDWMLKVGGTPMESSGWKVAYDGGLIYESINEYLYADGPTVVMASLRATKSYRVGKYNMPMFVELDVNPYTQKAYGMAGVTFRPFRK